MFFYAFHLQCDFFGPDIPVKNGANGVLIVQYPNGRASGDAFVIFSSDKDLKGAMNRNKADMMGRYVELFRSSLKEFLTVSVLCVCVCVLWGLNQTQVESKTSATNTVV